MIKKLLLTFSVIIFPTTHAMQDAQDCQSLSSPPSQPLAINVLNNDHEKDQNSLREKAGKYEREGRLSLAAQTMDRYFKAGNPPAVMDLCYVLKLNSKLAQKNHQSRAHNLANQISKALKVKPADLNLNLVMFSWNHIYPWLDYVIQKTVENPSCEKKKFTLKVIAENFNDYCAWETNLRIQYPYPISFQGTTTGYASEKKLNGFYDCYMQISISNHTKMEEVSRQYDAYHYFEGKLDETKIDSKTFHNLLVRAVLKPVELSKGKHNSEEQKPVYVKPYDMKSTTLKEGVQEVEQIVLSTLQKSTKPYAALIFNLNMDTTFSLSELHTYQARNSFFIKFVPRATIIESKENRLYLFYENFQRNTLDLHGLSIQEAENKVTSFIKEKHINSEKSCKIITGIGNHRLEKGNSGILKKKLKEWLQSSILKPLIHSQVIGKGGGIYIISLKMD